MRSVLTYIAEQQGAFSRLPFFGFLRDPSISPAERFIFAPAGAPFIMAFADFNKYLLRSDDLSDPLQRIMNAHSREDDTHFWMYLKDLKTLGYDVSMKFSQALVFLWSDDRKRVRQTCYVLAGLLSPVGTNLRMVIVETVEALGAVAFGIFSGVADEYQASTGKELQYFGHRHEKLETGHAVGTDNIEARLQDMELTEAERERARQLVDTVFTCFCEMMNELFAYATQQRGRHAPSRGPALFDACPPS